jgi:Ca-activated chloride channel homolog
MAPAVGPGEFDMQLGIRSYDAVKPRRPMTITFVLDTSGSMAGPGITRERAAAIAGSLAAGDVVNMVTWNTTNTVILSGHKVSGPNDPNLVAAINALSADGGTDLQSGLASGYGLAKQHYGAIASIE